MTLLGKVQVTDGSGNVTLVFDTNQITQALGTAEQNATNFTNLMSILNANLLTLSKDLNGLGASQLTLDSSLTSFSSALTSFSNKLNTFNFATSPTDGLNALVADLNQLLTLSATLKDTITYSNLTNLTGTLTDNTYSTTLTGLTDSPVLTQY
jgi:hypothetical protein